MKRRPRFLLRIIVVSVLLGVGLFNYERGQLTRRHLQDRRRDLQALVGVCDAATNISTTEELIAEVTRQRVVLKAPLAKDPAKPCYRLVNRWVNPSLSDEDVGLEPQRVLIVEANLTDTNILMVVLMDGSVQSISGRMAPKWLLQKAE